MNDGEYAPYLVEYPFEGGIWSFHLQARSYDEAEVRLKALAWAKVKGRSVSRVPAAFRPMTVVEVWLRNLWSRLYPQKKGMGSI